jgi:DNA-binding GntR family transcriptional regulator
MGEKTSRQELAYSSVRQRIQDGRYGAGSRLIISEIAKDLGSSPIPIREALRRLEAEGFVKFLHNQGAVVRRVSAEDYVETLATMAVLEGYITALVSDAIDAKGINLLRSTNRRMAAAWANGDIGRFGSLNKDFHFIIYSYCPNRLMVDFINAAWARLDNVRQTSIALLPGRGQTSLAEHDEIIEALVKPDTKARIEKMAREHKLSTIKHFRKWQAENDIKLD